jgi:serine protease Do
MNWKWSNVIARRSHLSYVLLITCLVLGCRNSPGSREILREPSRQPAPIASPERRTPVVQVAEAILPSVVNIETEGVIRQRAFDPWFGLFPRDREYRSQSVGSGFIWAADGIIVTNAHVIEGAARINVNLYDGRKLPATVIGVDPDSDLAVLQVEGRGLPAAPIGSSSDLLIGEPVIAVGNPFGLSGTVTTGVVSAIGRSVPSRERDRTYTDFIQTDASINPGNSGGPLVNIEGRVIGINVAIHAEAQGIGFAIPVDRAAKIVEDLRRYGEVHPAWLGIATATLTPEEARRRGFQVESGVMVSRVFEGSPAARAGLALGDVIVGVGNTPVDSREALNTILASVTPGSALTFHIQRARRRIEIQISPGEAPATLGVQMLREISGLRVEDSRRGVVVGSVERGSRAEAVGLAPGDLIVAVNGRQVRSVEELNALLRRSVDRTSIVLSVARGNFVYTLTFPMGV